MFQRQPGSSELDYRLKKCCVFSKSELLFDSLLRRLVPRYEFKSNKKSFYRALEDRWSSFSAKPKETNAAAVGFLNQHGCEGLALVPDPLQEELKNRRRRSVWAKET